MSMFVGIYPFVSITLADGTAYAQVHLECSCELAKQRNAQRAQQDKVRSPHFFILSFVPNI